MNPDALMAMNAAMVRWLAAVESHGDTAATDAAVASDVAVSRYGFGDTRDHVVEGLNGTAAVAEWLARTNPVCVFSIETVALADDGTGVARYRIDAPDFLGGGVWRVVLATDGRIAQLEHRPDDLRPEYGPPMPDWANVVLGGGDDDDGHDHAHEDGLGPH